MDPRHAKSHRPQDLDLLTERRRSRRVPVPELLVTLGGSWSETPTWAGRAVDISEGGLALAMTPEVEVGRELLVSFELAGTSYERLPAVVLRHDLGFGVGALGFHGWPREARESLASCLEH
jgi:hypothetical protein